MSILKWCPDCKNLLYHTIVSETQLVRKCRNCGYHEGDGDEEEQSKMGGLVMETNIQERENESHKVLLNEFTRQDPTLPHTKEIKCPNGNCPSNKSGAPRDVIIMKYDAANLKFIYICNVEGCGETWRTRS